MNHFSIKDIEALTGIKSHTIRIWEQRYNLVQPSRTNTNIRYYTDEDLKNLLNISLLNRSGYKISRISQLTKEQIDQIILEQSSCDDTNNFQVHALLGCMLSLDEQAFNKVLNTNIEKIGLRKTMTDIIFPFLKHIGLLWMAGTVNPALEHFVTNIIKSKLFSAIDQLGFNSCTGETKKFLLFLPEGETHVIGLLFGNFLIRAAGHQSIYLGQNLPDKEIDLVIHSFKPQFILTSIVSGKPAKEIQKWISSFALRYPDKKILVTGHGFTNNEIKLPENVSLIKSPECLDNFLECGKKQ